MNKYIDETRFFIYFLYFLIPMIVFWETITVIIYSSLF